ncbi:merozoite surface protein 2-like [Watersipora subatra]|uniref:merozoite surface protein 2-like n=1 Tax=Watersipora subatra TaxID=2589382 RepID=UPI00355ADC58
MTDTMGGRGGGGAGALSGESAAVGSDASQDSGGSEEDLAFSTPCEIPSTPPDHTNQTMLFRKQKKLSKRIDQANREIEEQANLLEELVQQKQMIPIQPPTFKSAPPKNDQVRETGPTQSEQLRNEPLNNESP